MELEVGVNVTDLAPVDDERKLIERARKDREAFAMLYRRHYSAIAGYVFRRVGDAHVAEDLVSDVFVAALRHLHAYRHRRLTLRAWLYRIATNRVNRWARRERSKAMKQLTAEPPVPTSSNGDQAVQAEKARMALLTLAPKYQAVLSLHYLEGMPIADVANALGCRLGTVKSRLARGRDELRRRL